MAIIKTYPLKNNYYGPDRLILSDMQPDDQGVVHGTTKSLTLSNLKSFIGGGGATLQLTTNFTSGAATFDVNTNILNIPDYSVGNVDGSGTAGRIPKWQDANTLDNSEIFQSGTSIGIGTTNPTQILTVAGTIMSTATTNPTLILQDTTHSDITIKGDSGTFSVSNANVGQNITMLYNGYVGIGTTTPIYKLDVNGNFRAKGITSSSKHTVTIEAIAGWYRIMQWSGPSRGGAIVKLSTIGGNVTPTTYVINAYKTYGSPANSNTLKLEQYGDFGAITKARIATDSVTSVTYVEIYNAYTSASYTIEVYHDSLLGLDSLTSVLTGQLQTGPNSVSQDELPFVYEGTTTEKLSSELVTLIGDGTNDGKLRFNCSANSHYVEIVGPTHSGGSSYSLKLPNTLPSVSNQILESNALGVLSWIPTPSGGGGGGGTLNTVGLTMPSAFSVGNSPLTGTGGTISVTTTGGSAGQYLDYQGNWSTPTDTNSTYSLGTGSTAGQIVLTGSNPSTSQTVTVAGTNGMSITQFTSGTFNINLDLATSSTRGGVKVGFVESGKNYPVELSSEKMFVNVPWTDTVYTLPEATATARGGIELFSNNTQTTAANAVTTTASRTYGIQLNSSGQAVVNVPWTSGGGGGGISFSGNTADGLATYSSSTTAAVSSDVRLRNNFMTFDGSSEGTGVDFYSVGATNILRFGDMTGDTAATVELWTDGSRRFEIGINGEIGLGTGASQGTSGQVLTSQGNGSPATWSSSSGQNIANTNLTQTANRTYAMGQYAMTFTGTSSISMQQSNGLVVGGNIISNSQSYAAKNSISNKNTSFTVDCNDGNVQQVNLTNGAGNVIISFSNVRAGARYTVITTRLGNEGTYGTYSFNSVLWPNNSTPQNVPAGSGTFNMYEFVATTTSSSGMLGYFFRNYQTSS